MVVRTCNVGKSFCQRTATLVYKALSRSLKIIPGIAGHSFPYIAVNLSVILFPYSAPCERLSGAPFSDEGGVRVRVRKFYLGVTRDRTCSRKSNSKRHSILSKKGGTTAQLREGR